MGGTTAQPAYRVERYAARQPADEEALHLMLGGALARGARSAPGKYGLEADDVDRRTALAAVGAGLNRPAAA